MTFQVGTTSSHGDYSLGDFDLELSPDGINWTSLNDVVNYRVAADDSGNSAYQRRRITATSPYYDGTYNLHSTMENVEESLSIRVHGYSQSHVTENINQLIYLVSFPSYNLRKRVDDHMETWLCQPADYSIDRSHILMHNCQALVKLSIPRHPKVSYEVVI